MSEHPMFFAPAAALRPVRAVGLASPKRIPCGESAIPADDDHVNRVARCASIAFGLSAVACGGGSAQPSVRDASGGATGSVDGAGDASAGDTGDPRANPDLVWPGAGCGKPLPVDQPPTKPATPLGYKHYVVMGTGANLTDMPIATNAVPRTFWVRVPADYEPTRPYRVVYIGQGCGGYQVANTMTYQLFKESLGGTEQAIYVALDLPENGANQDCYDVQSGPGSEEWEAFPLIQQLVDANYCADLNRIYVVGDGTGGSLANMWGCYYAGWPTPARRFAPSYHIRAQVAVMGGEPAEQPPCGGPVAALILHDTQSPNPFAGAISALTRVGRMNGCDTTYGDAALQAPWHEDVMGEGICAKYVGCPAAYPVVFCTTTGQGNGDQHERAIPGAKLFFDELEAAR